MTSRLISIVGLLALVILACWPSAATLGALWMDFANLSYSHGFALAAVSVWLLFRDRREIAAEPARPSVPAYIALLACTLAWIVFWRAGIEALHMILLPVLMGLAVYAAFGYAVASRLVFPLALLYFALPVWEWLTPLLQSATVHAVGVLLPLARVPASIEGNLVFVPGGTFEVAGGCSGLHYFVVGLALAALLGELDRHTLPRRMALLAIMAGLALLANWVRVLIIVWVGYSSGMDHYLIHNHYLFGWVVFAVGVVLFFWIGRRFSAVSAMHSDEKVAQATAPASPQILPLAFASAVLIVAAAPLASGVTRLRETGGKEEGIALVLPSAKGAWSGPVPVYGTGWRPAFIGAHGQTQATYSSDASGRNIEVFAVVYRVQRQGAELVGFGNSLLGAQQQRAQESRVVDSPVGRFHETVAVDSNDARFLVWSVYDVAGRRFVKPVLSQVWYGLSSLAREQPSALFALRTRCGATCDEARSALARFAGEMNSSLQTAVRNPASQAAWAHPATELDHPPPAQLQQALDSMRRGDYARAEAEFIEAQSLGPSALTLPHYAMLMAGLVEARLAQNKLVEAQAAHQKLAQLLPEAPPTRLLGARLMLSGGEPIEGVSELRRLVMAEPRYLPARLVLGRVLLAQGNLLQAEAQLKAVTSEVPNHPEARVLLAQVRQRSMRPEEIDNPLILNNLAWLYFEQGDQRAEAVARRAYELAPENAAVADTYGWILLQNKAVDRALPLLAAAARAAPDDTEIQYHHAAGLVAAGSHSDARLVLQRLLAATTSFARRSDAEQLLKTLPR